MRAWGRFATLIMVVAVVASALGGASAQSPAAGYRCAGTGTLTGTYQEFGPDPGWYGWQWSLKGQAACVLSPDGPWQGTIGGRAYGCGISSPVGLTENALTLPERLGVTFTLSNPRTGRSRELSQVWDLVTARYPGIDEFPPTSRAVDAPAYLLVVHRVVEDAPCKGDPEPGDGLGALVHIPTKIYRWQGDRVNDPFSFVSNSPGGA